MTTEVDQLVNAMRLLRDVTSKFSHWADAQPASSMSDRALAGLFAIQAELATAIDAMPKCPKCFAFWEPGPCPGCGLA